MSEEQKAVEPIVAEEKPKIKLQYVFVTLADGRKGIFAGPELITKAELDLYPPKLVDIVFSEPQAKEELPSEKPSDNVGK